MARIKYTENNLLRKLFGSKENVIFLWIFLVLFAKVIRYTVLKETLVDAGIGHKMVAAINNNSTFFSFFDSQNSKDSIGDSIGNAAFFWDKINLLHLNTYIGFEVFITVIWNILMIVCLYRCKSNFNTIEILFLITSILMLNIFDFTISKEPIQAVFFLICFFVLVSNMRHGQKVIWTFGVIMISVFTFRSYYILMIFWAGLFFFLQHLLLKKRINVCKLLIIFLCISFSYFLLLFVLQKTIPSVYNEFIRVRTRESTATTDIRLWFPSSNLTMFCLDYFIIVLRLLFPIELIRFGPKFFVYVISQLIMSSIYLGSFFKIRTALFEEKISFCLFSGFIFMSAAFEPDFGSWVRHEAALFPIMLIFSGLIQSKNNKESYAK